MASFIMAKLNRQQRRRLEATAPAVDRVTEADARFFARFPDRRHRLRPMSAAELQQMVASGILDDAGPGERWGVAMRQVVAGARVRRAFRCKRDADLIDQPEAVAASTFAQLADADPRAPIIEAQVLAIMGRDARP